MVTEDERDESEAQLEREYMMSHVGRSQEFMDFDNEEAEDRIEDEEEWEEGEQEEEVESTDGSEYEQHDEGQETLDGDFQDALSDAGSVRSLILTDDGDSDEEDGEGRMQGLNDDEEPDESPEQASDAPSKPTESDKENRQPGEESQHVKKVAQKNVLRDKYVRRRNQHGVRMYKRNWHVNRAYVELLNTEIEEVINKSPLAAVFDGLTELEDSTVNGVFWTAKEKSRFFDALSHCGRGNVVGIAEYVKTKGIVECTSFLRELAREESRKDPYYVTLGKVLPAAIEVPEKMEKKLEAEAEHLERWMTTNENLQQIHRFGLEGWMVDEDLAADKRRMEGEIPETALFRMDKMLRLSKKVYMNTPEFVWANHTPSLKQSPAITREALTDLHSLVHCLARRIVSTIIFVVESRVRAMKSAYFHYREDKSWPIKIEDVHTALDILNLPRDRLEYFRLMPRRLGLKVAEKTRPQPLLETSSQANGIKYTARATYDEIEEEFLAPMKEPGNKAEMIKRIAAHEERKRKEALAMQQAGEQEDAHDKESEDEVDEDADEDQESDSDSSILSYASLSNTLHHNTRLNYRHAEEKYVREVTAHQEAHDAEVTKLELARLEKVLRGKRKGEHSDSEPADPARPKKRRAPPVPSWRKAVSRSWIVDDRVDVEAEGDGAGAAAEAARLGAGRRRTARKVIPEKESLAVVRPYVEGWRRYAGVKAKTKRGVGGLKVVGTGRVGVM